MIRITALTILVLGIIVAGCSSPAPQQEAGTPQPTQTSFYYFGNGTFNVNGTFQQVNGTLHIQAYPPETEIYIDNEYRCRGGCSLSYRVPPGRHILEFRRDGYETIIYPVLVEKGGMEGINVTLEKKGDRVPVASAPTGRS